MSKAAVDSTLVRRLVPYDGAVLMLGGAANGENFDLIARVMPAPRVTNATDARV